MPMNTADMYPIKIKKNGDSILIHYKGTIDWAPLKINFRYYYELRFRIPSHGKCKHSIFLEDHFVIEEASTKRVLFIQS